MKRRTLLIVLLLALGALPAVSPAAAEPEPDFIAINPRGVVPVEMDGGAFVFTADLFSLTTGEKIGTFTDRGTCSTSAPRRAWSSTSSPRSGSRPARSSTGRR